MCYCCFFLNCKIILLFLSQFIQWNQGPRKLGKILKFQIEIKSHKFTVWFLNT